MPEPSRVEILGGWATEDGARSRGEAWRTLGNFVGKRGHEEASRALLPLPCGSVATFTRRDGTVPTPPLVRHASGVVAAPKLGGHVRRMLTDYWRNVGMRKTLGDGADYDYRSLWGAQDGLLLLGMAAQLGVDDQLVKRTLFEIADYATCRLPQTERFLVDTRETLRRYMAGCESGAPVRDLWQKPARKNTLIKTAFGRLLYRLSFILTEDVTREGLAGRVSMVDRDLAECLRVTELAALRAGRPWYARDDAQDEDVVSYVRPAVQLVRQRISFPTLCLSAVHGLLVAPRGSRGVGTTAR